MRIPPDLSKEFIGSPLLYRALRPEEVDAGCILVPKGQGPFASRSRRLMGGRRDSPEETAIRQHHWRQRGCPSRGVSTTPHLFRARRYAEAEGGTGVIVEIDRRLFERNWIREYPVNEILARFPDGIAAPDDEEIILVCELEGPFPKEIVKRVIRVEETHHTLPRLAAPRDEPWNAYARGESNSTAHRDR